MIFVWSLKFYHKPVRSCSILAKKKARFYVGFGVSQTPKKSYRNGGFVYGTQVYICGFAGGGTGKSDCGMVSPPAWIFAPYYYGLKTHRGRHFPKRRPRLDEPGRARRGCDRNAPCRNRTLRRNSAAAGSVFGCV